MTQQRAARSTRSTVQHASRSRHNVSTLDHLLDADLSIELVERLACDRQSLVEEARSNETADLILVSCVESTHISPD
jgi:hypothetical protein